jgi:hypothetical protein
MAYKFTDAGRYRYEPEGFFLGADDEGREVGIRSERHLITVAGAGSGKGAALIVPNLKRWRGSCVVVDPKGENATITAAERAGMGQHVGVVDPYETVTGNAAGLRCSINPLDLLDPESLTFRADLEVLADGLVRTFDPKHEEWAETARRMIAGVADAVIATQPRENWTLPTIRAVFVLPPDGLERVAKRMASLETETGLAQEAGSLFLSKLANGDSLDAQAFTKAGKELGWIGDKAFRPILNGDLPRFDLRTLKAGTGSLYLCIDPDKLRTRGQFLRLFVSMGLQVMMSGLAKKDDPRCLFLLDEFHSLGRLDQVAVAAGLMRGYGVQLWPFLQDLGQLEKLYGPNEMHTFFSNADAHIFFGNTDKPTLDYVSQRLGIVTPDEIGPPPAMGGGGNVIPLMAPQRRRGRVDAVGIGMALMQSLNHAGASSAQARYQHKQMMVGKPRVAPDQARELTAKHDGDKVARSMIVFAKGKHVLNVRLAPYFAPMPRPLSAAHVSAPPKELAGIIAARLSLGLLLVAPFMLFIILAARNAPGGGLPAPLLLLTVALYAAVGAWLFKARIGRRLCAAAGVPFF